MANNTGSRALTAKVHAMYGRRLTQQNFRELVRKQTVSEIASYIKQQTAYAPLLRDVNESLIHRGQLENILRRDLFEEYLKFFHYLNMDETRYYKFLVMKMEIDEVLSCIRLLNSGRIDDYIFSLPSFFATHADFDLYGLAKLKNFDELLRLLASTPYYEILKKYGPADGEKIDITKIEIEFNNLYFDRVFDVIKNTFSGSVNSQIKESFGMQIDLNNITDIIRLKKYFNAKSDYIRTLLLPHYFKVSKNELEAMMEAPDADAAWQLVGDTYYGKTFKKYNFEFVEKYAQQIMYEYHKHLFSFTDSAPVAVTSYLMLKKTEISNMIHIIEGIRYGLAPAEIGKLLVGVEI